MRPINISWRSEKSDSNFPTPREECCPEVLGYSFGLHLSNLQMTQLEFSTEAKDLMLEETTVCTALEQTFRQIIPLNTQAPPNQHGPLYR